VVPFLLVHPVRCCYSRAIWWVRSRKYPSQNVVIHVDKGVATYLDISHFSLVGNLSGRIHFSSFQERAYTMARRLSSVCPSVRLSVFKLLRKSLLLPGKWPDRHQTFTRWTPGQRASRVKVKGHLIRALSWILGMSYSVIDGLVVMTNWKVLIILQILSSNLF